MILCRVVLGLPATLLQPDPAAVADALDAGYNSIIGDREKAVGTYREFVVFNNSDCYPEYVVLYKRIYK